MLNLFTSLHVLALTARDRLVNEEKGASAVEYALLIGVIAVMVIVAGVVLQEKVIELFKSIKI